MIVSSYFLASLLWSVAGFAIGFFAGRIGASYEMRKTMGTHNSTVPTWKERLLAKLTLQTAFGVIVLILIGIGMTSLVSGNSRVEEVVACQTRFNEEYSRGLNERSDAAKKERNAQRELLTVNLDPNATEEDRANAVRTYLETLNVADAQRNNAPIPVLRCDATQ